MLSVKEITLMRNVKIAETTNNRQLVFCNIKFLKEVVYLNIKRKISRILNFRVTTYRGTSLRFFVNVKRTFLLTMKFEQGDFSSLETPTVSPPFKLRYTSEFPLHSLAQMSEANNVAIKNEL